MSTNHALLLGQDVEHALHRLSWAWAGDEVSPSSLSRPWQPTWSVLHRGLARLGVEEHEFPCLTRTARDLSRRSPKEGEFASHVSSVGREGSPEGGRC